ncbi:MAG: peptidylprolyl isomerase [Terracidiphilus sp.]
MIRFLQRDNRVTKAFFVVVIAAASVGMVVYLIPGLTGMGTGGTDTYAMIYPHWYSRFLNAGISVSQMQVSQMARKQMQRQQLPESSFIVNYFEQQAGSQLVRDQVLLAKAEQLGIHATNQDVADFLHQGAFGEYIFPKGQYIGDDRYADFVARQINMSVTDFENAVKQDIAIRRLQALITAGITVGDTEVRENYRKNNIKIKFDYAVITSDDVRKTINPSDDDLEAFFKANGPRYASAVPEERKVTYFVFTPNQVPGGMSQPTQQEVQQYFRQHEAEYQTPEQARSRHILIKLEAGADAKADAAAKAKAEGILKQIQGGANFADLAKKNSDDPGSKDSGGELGFAQRGRMVPAFDSAIFSQKIGETKIVKSQFGYHIVQVEERQEAHAQSLAEVAPVIQATLSRQKSSVAEENYARNLTSEAIQKGLEKTAAAHHLEVVTSPFVGPQGVIGTLPDSAQIVGKAFQSKQGDPPQFAPVGEGYAIFQVSGIQAAHAPAFADYKAKIGEDYRDEKLPALLTAKTQELANKAKATGDLAKAAKEAGATVKTSDLLGPTGQAPDLGQISTVAPQLLEMKPGDFSGAISTGRTGVVAKLLDKQEPTADEIAKNFDQTRDQMLEQRRGEAFNVFMSALMEDFKKHNRIRLNPKAKPAEIPGM